MERAMVKFSSWLEDETLGELVGLLDDSGRALLERVYNAGREAAEQQTPEHNCQEETLRLRLREVITAATNEEHWCKPELHTHILRAAMGSAHVTTCAIPASSDEPFCVCGRRHSDCDGSRKGCRREGIKL
jgi:hypothetical protein